MLPISITLLWSTSSMPVSVLTLLTANGTLAKSFKIVAKIKASADSSYASAANSFSVGGLRLVKLPVQLFLVANFASSLFKIFTTWSCSFLKLSLLKTGDS